VRIVAQEVSAYESAGAWQLDQEIEQTVRLLQVWETQAQLHRDTAFGEIVNTVASGYAIQLQHLRQARASV
jgi:hypothetical protein